MTQVMLQPSDLSFEVPLTFEGTSATCPRCGHLNVCTWGTDHLNWWPQEGHCRHFTGVYVSGRLGTVEAKFR